MVWLRATWAEGYPEELGAALGQSPAAPRGPPGAASASRGTRLRGTAGEGTARDRLSSRRWRPQLRTGEGTDLRARRGSGIGRRGAGVAARDARSFRRRPRPPDAPLARQSAALRPENARRVASWPVPGCPAPPQPGGPESLTFCLELPPRPLFFSLGFSTVVSCKLMTF